MYYKGMLDVLPERVIRFRLPDLTIIYCNAAWAGGHNLTPAEVVGRTMDDLPSPATKRVQRPTLRAAGSNGSISTCRVMKVPRSWPSAAMSPTAMWRFFTDPYPHFDYLSPSIENLIGYPATIFLDDFTRLLDILDDEGRELVGRALDGDPTPLRYDLRYRCADGSTVIFETQTTDIPGGMQGVSRDVTELRNLQDSLAALALRDPLTGLANRHLLNELLEAALARTERSGLPLAVAFLDLDSLKVVNDTYGHDAGDVVLCETARRLSSLARSADRAMYDAKRARYAMPSA